MGSAISIDNLGKHYRLDHQGSERARYRTLRESMTDAVASPFRWVGDVRSGRPRSEEFWALKNVSFDVQPGEVVGIIGRNGAGKSTLLKILSRITKPSTGFVRTSGRVGSLLEVGTGFHPELTGRENIYLNGSILGMRRDEIRRRFDEIVEFSGVERFLDTPVKRYSSGMQVRLAFAVAAHLDPEILIVDEVLAVGDIAFQSRCLARMQEITRSGRTILFVSHNLAAVQSLCTRGILLANGAVSADGGVSEIVARFLRSMASGSCRCSTGSIALGDHVNRRSSSRRILRQLNVTCAEGREDISVGGALTIDLTVDLPPQHPALSLVVFVCKADGERLASFHSRVHAHVELTREAKANVRCHVPELPLLPGTYRIDLAVASTDEVYDYIDHVTDLVVVPGDYLGTGLLPSNSQGVVALKSEWQILSSTIA